MALNELMEKVIYEIGNIESLLLAKLKSINQMYNFKGKHDECSNSNECCDICDNDEHCEYDDICKECGEKCIINNSCNSKSNDYKKNIFQEHNNGNIYNAKNEYYQNYNKITDMVSKMFGRGGESII